MQWAYVEQRLAIFFNMAMTAEPAAVDAVWNRIRSFEAKLLVLHDVIVASGSLSQTAMRDWNLLKPRIMADYGKRNQVAHSTPQDLDGVIAGLEPFAKLVISSPPRLLTKDDLLKFCQDFAETNDAVDWISAVYSSEKWRRPLPEPTPDLIHHLRTQDDRKREEQRLRDLAVRQAQHPK